jgi:RNA polymerase sigma factor (TIGR02999 family)
MTRVAKVTRFDRAFRIYREAACYKELTMTAPPDENCSLEEMTAVVYSELRRLAGGYLRGANSLTLQPTALVHEVYLRMAGQDGLRWKNRGHFFGIAARSMRQILVEHARARGAKKRGGGVEPGGSEALMQVGSEQPAEILELDDALRTLSRIDERRGQMIELHYFGGFDYEEIAEAMETSTATVKRDLRAARAWLLNELGAR